MDEHFHDEDGNVHIDTPELDRVIRDDTMAETVKLAPKWAILLCLFDLVEQQQHEDPKAVRDLFEDGLAILDDLPTLLEPIAILRQACADPSQSKARADADLVRAVAELLSAEEKFHERLSARRAKA